MKAWDEVERGGSGADARGAIRCRDPHAYNRLRVFFSKEFMLAHWYVPDRSRKAPHELAPTKACKACGITKRNDFKEFQREPFGPKQYGRFTTADTCRMCIGRAVSTAQQARSESDRAARAAYEETGDELWKPKQV